MKKKHKKVIIYNVMLHYFYYIYLPHCSNLISNHPYHQSLEGHPQVFAQKSQDDFHQTLVAFVF